MNLDPHTARTIFDASGQRLAHEAELRFAMMGEISSLLRSVQRWQVTAIAALVLAAASLTALAIECWR